MDHSKASQSSLPDFESPLSFASDAPSSYSQDAKQQQEQQPTIHLHLLSTPASTAANQNPLSPANDNSDGCSYFPAHIASSALPSRPTPTVTHQGVCKREELPQQVHLYTRTKAEAAEAAETSKEPAMLAQDFIVAKSSHQVNLASASTLMYNLHKRRSSGSISVSSSRSSSSNSDFVHNSADLMAYAKPELSYAAIITEAIQSNHNQLMTLSEIYSSIIERYPYFKTAPPGWKNSIRHNLSLHKSFARVARPSNIPGKGSFWKLATGGPEEIPKKSILRSARSESDPGITLTLGSRSASLGAVTAAGSGAGLFSHLNPNGKDEHHSVGGMHRVSVSQSSIPHSNMFFYSPPLVSHALSAAASTMSTTAAAARRRAHSIMPNTGPAYLSPMPSSLYSISNVNGSGDPESSTNAAYLMSSTSTLGSSNEIASQASLSTTSYCSSNSSSSSMFSPSSWLPVYHPSTGQFMYSMPPASNASQSSPQSWDPLYAIHQSAIQSHHYPQPLDPSAAATMAEQQPAQVSEWLSTLPHRPPTEQAESSPLLNIVGRNSYSGSSGSDNIMSPLHRHSMTATGQVNGVNHGLAHQNASSYMTSYQPSKVAAAATLQRRKSSLMMVMGGTNDESITSDISADMVSTTGYMTPEGSSSPQPSSMLLSHTAATTLSGNGASSVGQGGVPLTQHQSLLTPSSSPVHHHPRPSHGHVVAQTYDAPHEATHCYGMSSTPSSGMILMVTPTETLRSNTPIFYDGYSVPPSAYPSQVTSGQNAMTKSALTDSAYPLADFLYAQQQPQAGAFTMDYAYSLSSASLLEQELLGSIQTPTLIPQAMTPSQAQQASMMSAINLQAAQAQGQPGSVYRQAALSSYSGDSASADALEFVVDDKPPSMEWIYM